MWQLVDRHLERPATPGNDNSLNRSAMRPAIMPKIPEISNLRSRRFHKAHKGNETVAHLLVLLFVLCACKRKGNSYYTG